jgi:predicted nuclease of restriction endonuclease-like (RecB) superfamily
MNATSVTADYGTLLTDLKARIHAAQYAALRAVNKELIALYWDIGKLIEERQRAEGWGKSVVERLSVDLRAEFGEKSGFSVQNLWYMRKFYREYKDAPKLQPLAGEIAWTKNTLILDRCADPFSCVYMPLPQLSNKLLDNSRSQRFVTREM